MDYYGQAGLENRAKMMPIQDGIVKMVPVIFGLWQAIHSHLSIPENVSPPPTATPPGYKAEMTWKDLDKYVKCGFMV